MADEEGSSFVFQSTFNIGAAGTQETAHAPSPRPEPTEEIAKEVKRNTRTNFARMADGVYRMSRIYAPFLRYIPGFGPQLAATSVGLGRGLANVAAELIESKGLFLKGFVDLKNGLVAGFHGDAKGALLNSRAGFSKIGKSLGTVGSIATIAVGALMAILSISRVFRSMMGVFFTVIVSFMDILLAPMVIMFLPLITALMQFLPFMESLANILAAVLKAFEPFWETAFMPLVLLVITVLTAIWGVILIVSFVLGAIGAFVKTIVNGVKWLIDHIWPFQTGGTVNSSKPVLALLHPNEEVFNPARGWQGMSPLLRSYLQPNISVRGGGGGTTIGGNRFVTVVTNVNVMMADNSYVIPVRSALDEINDTLRRSFR